jgi:hypothetical protein
VEGGFDPDDITPRPPFTMEARSGGSQQCAVLTYNPACAGAGERTLLGGLKTKDVDVVVAKNGIGPCVAVSIKGTLNAFRNLTNRMEEAVGDCTNLHIAYPALVYGFLHVMRANKEGRLPSNGAHFMQPDERGNVKAADVALRRTGEPAEAIVRYHDVLVRLTGRRDIRDDAARYEAIALALADPTDSTLGQVATAYPRADSPLLLRDFFRRLYDAYDQRFVYAAPALASTTRRLEWDSDSPALSDPRCAGFEARVSS